MVSTSNPALDYTPYGACRRLFYCHDAEVVISGPAGTGKSLACLAKMDFLARRVAGFRGLIVRKTRESLTESGLVTYERHVLPEGDPVRQGPQRRMRQTYSYPNGSEIVVGGLDKPGKIMSTEYDCAYVQEAIELTEEAWESLTTRLRNGKLPFQQLMADTNPDKPTHWLKKRCDAGRCRMLESRHEDNPTVTAAYLAKLDALTGPRKERLRYGRWAQSEGVVYEGWDAAVHLVDSFCIPHDWPRLLAIDWGYNNPFVCQWWAVDPDGRLVMFREIYHTKRLVEDHARRIVALNFHEPAPAAIICDTDKEDRMTFERHTGWETTAALKTDKDKRMGLQAVMNRLRVQGDGKPRLWIMRDSLDEIDKELEDKKRPICTHAEFDGYIWDTKGGKKVGEEPIKENDHGCDAMRYLVWAMDCDGGVMESDAPMVIRA